MTLKFRRAVVGRERKGGVIKLTGGENIGGLEG